MSHSFLPNSFGLSLVVLRIGIEVKVRVSRVSRLLSSQEELCMGGTSTLGMTRKDKMRKGFVSRNFHIPIDIDEELRIKAVKSHVRFSDMAILAFREFLQGRKMNSVDGNTLKQRRII